MMGRSLYLSLLPLLLVLFLPWSGSAQNSGNPELVIHLLDYLAKDYGGAVQNGKVISESEYAEQVEFAKTVQTNANNSASLSADADFKKGIESLIQLINSKGPADDVSALARKLQNDAIRLAGVEVAPKSWPDLAIGAELFQKNCTACHGEKGKGDGPAGINLDPKPANFFDPDLVLNSAPYKFFNTIRLGVPGTGMAAYSQLSDQEVWALAFYLKALPHQGSADGSTKKLDVSLKDRAVLTDAEIADRFGGKNPETLAAVGALRTESHSGKNGDPLVISIALLGESLQAAREQNHHLASELAVRSYLEGVELLEPKLRANIPGATEELEAKMLKYRELLQKKAPITEIEASHNAVVERLNEVGMKLSDKAMSPAVAFGAAFSIFLREGFEAILIIIVLISILKAMGQTEAVRYVHIGWGLAVAVGIIAWFASGVLLAMSGLSRELMEGAIALLAVGVLIYVGFWLHRYSEMKKWRTFLEAKLKHGLRSGSYTVLALVSFMAVFREAFEVVLFLRAIWIDLDQAGQTAATGGVVASVVCLVGLYFLAIRQSRKLPLELLFRVCSWMMIILAVVLAGKGVRALQEAGLVPATSLPLPIQIDLIGLYPTVQTLALQILVIAFFWGLLLFETRQAARVKSSPQ